MVKNSQMTKNEKTGNGDMTKLKCERLMVSLKPSLQVSTLMLFETRIWIRLSHHRWNTWNTAWDDYHKRKVQKIREWKGISVERSCHNHATKRVENQYII